MAQTLASVIHQSNTQGKQAFDLLNTPQLRVNRKRVNEDVLQSAHNADAKRVALFYEGDPIYEDTQKFVVTMTQKPQRWYKNIVVTGRFPNRARTDWEASGNVTFYRNITRNKFIAGTDNTEEQRNHLLTKFRRYDARQPNTIHPTTPLGVTFGIRSLE